MTKAGLEGDSEWITENVQPGTDTGAVLENLERYVSNVPKYNLAASASTGSLSESVSDRLGRFFTSPGREFSDSDSDYIVGPGYEYKRKLYAVLMLNLNLYRTDSKV